MTQEHKPEIREVSIQEAGQSYRGEAVRLLNIVLSDLRTVDRAKSYDRRRPKREIEQILKQRRPQILEIENALSYFQDRENHGQLVGSIRFLVDTENRVLGFKVGEKEHRRRPKPVF